MDHFKKLYPNRDDVTECAIVDHNQLDVEQEEWLGKNVTRVIDHHVDSGAYADNLIEKECRFVGSACSLIALMFQRKQDLFSDDLAKSDEPNLAYMLAAAVCLDSYNFLSEIKNKKWNDDDLIAHNFLSQFADVGTDYWKVLNDTKFNTQAALDLGLHACFIRDYKNYSLKHGIMGAAVVTGSIDQFVAKFGQDQICAECEVIVDRYKLGLFVIISIHADENGHLEKGLSVYKPKQTVSQLTETFDDLLNHLEGIEDINLADKNEVSIDAGKLAFFKIGNHSYTRKAFEAIVKKFYA